MCMSFSFLLIALKKVLINLFSAIFAVGFLEWILFDVIGKAIVLSTKTPVDNEGLTKLKKFYFMVKEGKDIPQKE